LLLLLLLLLSEGVYLSWRSCILLQAKGANGTIKY
jgi:hypothetical protein